MAENIPPTSAATAPADQPGRPYYESLRTSLTQTLAKKRALDDQLSALEDQIYKAETSYLEETANSGNIVRGFDGWAKGVQIGGGRGDDRRRGRVREDERVFSRSSVGFMRAQENSDSNTPSHAPTPTASFAAGAGRDTSATGSLKAGKKKKRQAEKDEDDDVKVPKRGKITYARD